MAFNLNGVLCGIITLSKLEAFALPFVTCATFLLVWLLLRRFFRRQGWLPPGPIGIPLAGVIPRLSANAQHDISRWGKRYGSVYSFYFGSKLAVVLNDYESIKAAYEDQADTFSGRPPIFTFQEFYRPGFGLLNSEGEFFREQRRFLLKTFHELGVGKSRFEQLCIDEALSFVRQLVEESEKPRSKDGFDPEFICHAAIANETCALVYGRRFAYDDKLFHELVEAQREGFQLLSQAGPMLVFPWLRFVPPFRRRWQRFVECFMMQRKLSESELQRIIQQRQEKKYKDEEHEPQCVTEHFLAARNRLGLQDNYFAKNTDKKIFKNTDSAAGTTSTIERVFRMENILSNIEGLFGAATDTSVVTLLWSMIFLLHHPEIQEKCYQEILNNIGPATDNDSTAQPITWQDRHQLPYVEAFLLEVWRRGNLLPLSIQRRTVRDTHLGGYFIPKHTIIIPNLWNMHWDERYFQRPLEFEPERFIQGNGTASSHRVPSFWPFSAGKRACVGESIARMALFVFIANMIRNVQIVNGGGDDDAPLPSLTAYSTGSTLLPATFKIQIIQRAQQRQQHKEHQTPNE